MATNWLSKLGGRYRRSGWDNRAGNRDVDARRVRHELEAIRARFPDHV